MKYINIQPNEFIQTATKIDINVIYIELNNYAVIGVKLFDCNSKLLDSHEIYLEGTDYNNWNNDDYLINYVCEKFNLSLLNI